MAALTRCLKLNYLILQKSKKTAKKILVRKHQRGLTSCNCYDVVSRNNLRFNDIYQRSTYHVINISF